MPFEIPIFPLNVVLFPDMALPLHIFEPRYRLMIRRCLDADRKFGVALIADGEEGENGTLPSFVGTIAEITESLPFPDGRMNLQTIGRRRFRIIALREEDEYLIGTVEWFDDMVGEPSTPAWAAKVRRILRRYLQLLTGNTKITGVDLDELNLPRDPETLSMAVGALLTLTNEQKQDLLEMTSTAARLGYEFSLLRRAEVTQIAFARRVAAGFQTPPFSDALGQAGRFVSFN
jgi:Lon protease-like protein